MSPSALLVRMPNWLGDAVMAAWAMAEYAARRPGVAIDVLAREPVASLARRFAFVRDVYALERRSGVRSRARNFSLLASLKKKSYEAGLLLPNSLSSAVEMMLAVRGERIGFRRNGRGMLLTRPLRAPDWEKEQHLSAFYALLFRALEGGDTDAPVLPDAPAVPLDFGPGRAEFERLRADTGVGPKYAVIGAGAAYGEAKQWGVEKYAELARELKRRYGLDVLFLGSGADAPLSEAAARAGGGVSLCGRTSVAAALYALAGAAVFVGNDSGLMHMAAMTGTPTVGVFLSTEPRRTRPLGPRAGFVAARVDCRPCYRRECPRGNYACRDGVSVGEVLDRLEELRGGADG